MKLNETGLGFRRTFRVHPLASCSHTRASVTKQYNFGTGASWEGIRRSGIPLALSRTQ